MIKGNRESQRPVVINLPGFWDRMARSPRKLLALDYDGTLAPFRLERMQAFPYQDIPGLLEKIAGRSDTTLAIISGRPLAELAILLGSFDGIMVGSHGIEKRSANGDIVVKTPGKEQLRGLAEAQEAIQRRGLQQLLEVKPASVALHTRGLDTAASARLEEGVARLWQGITEGSGLEVRRFNGGVEIRAVGWNKGNALAELVEAMRQPAACVFVGDDDTDEDAFQRIRDTGFGIRVGHPDVPSAARGFLPDIPAVRDFLRAWTELAL